MAVRFLLVGAAVPWLDFTPAGCEGGQLNGAWMLIGRAVKRI